MHEAYLHAELVLDFDHVPTEDEIRERQRRLASLARETFSEASYVNVTAEDEDGHEVHDG